MTDGRTDASLKALLDANPPTVWRNPHGSIIHVIIMHNNNIIMSVVTVRAVARSAGAS